MNPVQSDARAWVRANLRGYFVAGYTPFRPDGEIDEPALRRNVGATQRPAARRWW
jgi:hypothetical protein